MPTQPRVAVRAFARHVACVAVFATVLPAEALSRADKLDSVVGELSREDAAGPGRAAAFARAHALGYSTAATTASEEVLVVIETTGAAADASAALAQAGARVERTAGRSALAWVEVARLGEVQGLGSVLAVRRPVRPIWDAITSQGVRLTGADRAQAGGGRGLGVRIGVIDVFQGYTAALGVELPPAARVTFKSFIAGGGAGSDNHGVYVAEILTDLAPDAELFLAAIDDDIGYKQAVSWLVTQGVRVINHSGGFGLYGDLKGGGPIHPSVAEAAAAGVVYVGAAGNSANSHWEGTFRDDNSNGELEFVAGVERLPFTVNGDLALRIDMSWDDWNPDPVDPRPSTDYDLCLYDAAGKKLSCSRDAQDGQAGQAPYEEISFTVPSAGQYSLGVTKVSGANLHLEITLIPDYSFGALNVRSSCLIVPADSPWAFTVGATDLNDILRNYSSLGPTNDGRLKPDLTGPDGVATSQGTFFGTSAACPHVAGAAAILLSLEPGLTSFEVMDRLRATTVHPAADPAPEPNNSYGNGRVNASFGFPPVPTPTPTPTPRPTPIAGGAGGGGGGGCRILDPARPDSPVALAFVLLAVLAYGAWLGRRP